MVARRDRDSDRAAATSKAKVIGNTVLFSEPQIDFGYVYITKLLEPPADIKAINPAIPDARAARRRRGEGRRQRRHRALRWQWT